MMQTGEGNGYSSWTHDLIITQVLDISNDPYLGLIY